MRNTPAATPAGSMATKLLELAVTFVGGAAFTAISGYLLERG